MNITQTGSGFPLCFLQANMVSGRGAIVSSCVREMWVVRCCLCIHSFCIDRALAVAIALELLGQALLYQDPRPKSPDTVTETRGNATIRVSQSDPPPHLEIGEACYTCNPGIRIQGTRQVQFGIAYLVLWGSSSPPLPGQPGWQSRHGAQSRHMAPGVVHCGGSDQRRWKEARTCRRCRRRAEVGGRVLLA